MKVIDAQVHAYEADHAGRPWIGTLAGPPAVTGDQMVTAMDSVGVDGALLVSPWSMYRYDASYALEVYEKYPGRFGLVKPVDPMDPAVNEVIQEWSQSAGSVAIRIMMAYGESFDVGSLEIKGIMDTAANCALPINLLCWECLEQAGELAKKFPNTRLVVDHLGLKQPFSRPIPENPFSDIQQLLALSVFDNISIKITGACTLSHEAYPFGDIWAPLAKIFDKFTFNRCMWGTDWTRAVDILTYQQGVDAFLLRNDLTADEKAKLMGKTLETVYNWSPKPKTND
ncbi:MAG: hypothetical protein CMM58_09440 [Rhodospirillaceae bacterium]|nr:hypothetical protein [Rhodospirillaceae bacterium]|tara:strand:- start:2381 stop:3232 length:852 start_codon:yes stop_codon:yes gene_type:complete